MGAALDTPFDSLDPDARRGGGRRAGCTAGRTDRAGAQRLLHRRPAAAAVHADFEASFPAEVPLTSIYSRGDGVVWWRPARCAYARNVEVSGSHIGLAFNRKAYR